MMECIYNEDEICTNDKCPMCADYCPVPDTEGICRYEEREEVKYELTPKGCLRAALLNNGIRLDDEMIELVWADFEEAMKRHGYVKEE